MTKYIFKGSGESDRKYTDNKHCKLNCCFSCTFCVRAAAKERLKSLHCKSKPKSVIKICEQCFLCRSLVFCQSCTKCQTCCTKSACRSQTKSIFGNLGSPRGGSSGHSDLGTGYTLPFQTRPNLTRSPSIISCYVHPRRNLYLLEALHQLINKNAVELVRNLI